ncbi:MAG: isocitrate/isopropylmalate dehydrogenase family protein, partial [Clostridiales bacterium]|nr:isocitrate/isopropylmalate dehydrogenase family protein [Clostridiales bacterium]
MKNYEKDIQEALKSFEAMLREQVIRNVTIEEERIKAENSDSAQSSISAKTTIGLASGDGIGPVIMTETKKVLEKLLSDELSAGAITLKDIDGFTIENRLALGETVPASVMEEFKQCDVLLKGPTTTPNAAMSGINLESANVYLRKAFDLYANVRPVKVPSENIDWIFFRENTEGEYALGSRGVRIADEFSVDFKVTTYEGSRRIAKAAFDYARENGRKKVSVITKANIMKKTDGDFQKICLEVAKDYPEIEVDTWFVDIMAANLVNKDIRSQFEVVVLPNLYGDIITDEAAQIQGGVGTAGSANIGSKYAIFEAIHGSAPRMVEDGIANRANPASLMTAAVMMLRHVGYLEKAALLEKAIAKADDLIGPKMTGLADGALCTDFSAEV